MLDGQDIIVLDLETLHSADDCRHCYKPFAQHYDSGACSPWAGDKPADSIPQFSALGWNDPPALGLSIGCWWDYQDARLHWFDRPTLVDIMGRCVARPVLMVSFNGIQFDFALMEGLARQEASVPPGLCDRFAALASRSYDLLAAIWERDPVRKFERGLNSLGAIALANGYGSKAMDGATAPRLWAEGQHAEVIAYNVSDVLKTKALFEQILTTGMLLRGDGQPILLPRPVLPS